MYYTFINKVCDGDLRNRKIGRKYRKVTIHDILIRFANHKDDME